MSFETFSSDPISSLVDSAGGAVKLTVLLGAGSSMEAGLPSWEGLLDRLLVRAARESALIDVSDEGELRRWQELSVRDGALSAAATIDALAGEERDRWIFEELFAPSGDPGGFFPGPISRQVPFLYKAFGDALRVLTLNYDDLLEQAFRDYGPQPAPVPVATENHHCPAGSLPIFHLHGYLGREAVESHSIILSEADYQAMQRGTSWQEALVRTALSDSTFVFVGTSLLDPNVLRYLHGVSPGRKGSRFAVFVRQGTYPADIPDKIPPARERALIARWHAVGVEAVFVDHYTDVAQILFEIAHRRERASTYRPLRERAEEWVTTVEREIVGVDSDEAFVHGQEVVGDLLRTSLEGAVSTAETLGEGPWDETMALTLWLVDSLGTTLTNRVTTDRMHLDRRTVEPVRISEHSRWLAVRSYCRGTALAESRDIYASRWRFIRGTPLVVHTERHGRIPVGCLTTASLAPREASRLASMAGDVEAAFNRSLTDPLLDLFERIFSGA